VKAGLLYADAINTVSRRYAEEIQTPEFGERMDGLLRTGRHDLYGIINGSNYHEFDPAHDPCSIANYRPERVHEKKDTQGGLQRELGLTVKAVPLFGIVSRPVDQKGLDLVFPQVSGLAAQGAQLELPGTGDAHPDAGFAGLAREFPGHVHSRFNGVLARNNYAGVDMVPMPPRPEPCGLGQLINLRYGTNPIVHRTGGLSGTIADYEPGTGAGHGFTIHPHTVDAFQACIQRALAVYRSPEAWRRLVVLAMEADFSWNRSVAEYMDLYDRASGKHGEVAGTA